MSKKIKHLIFDLGGVIINLDYTLSFKALDRMATGQVMDLMQNTEVQTHFNLHETGKISDAQFREGVRHFFGIQASDQAIDAAWNAMILDLPEQRLTQLTTLKEARPIYLLSNTNAIHIKYVLKVLQESTKYSNFEGLFNQVYYSHQVGMRKPNVDIYQKVIEDNNLVPEESIFFDDTLTNLEGAAKTGLHTYHVQSPEQMMNDIFSGKI